MKHNIGKKIRELRTQKGIKQSELAEILGISTSAVGMYEQNRREPDITALKTISEYFGVSLDYLLSNDGVSEQKENPADEGEIAEDVVIYHRDGKTVRRTFTKEQLDTITRMLDAIPDKPKDI